MLRMRYAIPEAVPGAPNRIGRTPSRIRGTSTPVTEMRAGSPCRGVLALRGSPLEGDFAHVIEWMV